MNSNDSQRLLGQVLSDVSTIKENQAANKQLYLERIEKIEEDSKDRDKNIEVEIKDKINYVQEEIDRLASAVFGDPGDKDNKAILPTMIRINLWLDGLCFLQKTLVRIGGGIAGVATFSWMIYESLQSLGMFK